MTNCSNFMENKMKLKLLVIFLILLFPSLVWSACTGASPTWTTTPDYASVSSCVSSAKVGDTINVSAGSVTWNNELRITKGINLIGAGAGQTIIKAGSIGSGIDDFIIQYDPTTAQTQPFRISGFTFNQNSSANGIGLGEGYNEKLSFVQDNVRVDHNAFTNIGDTFAVVNFCNYYGVIDSNTFSGSTTYPFKNDTQGPENFYYGDPVYGVYTLGSNKAMIYEDNTISLSGSSNMAFESQYDGRYVARYNTLTGLTSNAIFESHGHQTSGDMSSSFGVEVYGNKVTSASDSQLVQVRGGKSVAFYNYSSQAIQNTLSTSMVTCPSNYIEDQMVHDTYFWGSRVGYTGNIIATSSHADLTCNGRSNRPTANVDYWADATSFNGTKGIGCGTLANRPTTCTTGVGYWATNQSCTDLTGMVGVNPATPVSGTLYKCTATNTWTAYYTPYTYPHPLRGATDETDPTATWEIDSTGLIATGTFSESVNATTKTGVSFTGSVTGAITATYKDGMPGGIVRYDLNAEVQQADTVVVDYTTPGDGIKDLAGNALADISDGAVTNGSTQNSPPLVTLTIGAHTGATVNVYPGINCGSTCGPVEYDNGTVLTLSVQPMSNYTGCTIAGTGCGASTTMSEARTCTVTCTKISPDVTIGSGAAVTLGTGAVGTLY